MADDPARDLLVTALRRFRRATGEFSKDRVAADDALPDWIGEGDVDQAWNVITQLVEESKSDPDGDVYAFFKTCGWNTPGDTLDARLKQYANKYHVDERTALRRSDRGVIKVAQLLRDALVHERPLAQFFVFQNGPTVHVWVTVHVLKDSDWRRPRVYVNGERLKHLQFALNARGMSERYLKGSERLSEIPLNVAAEETEAMASIRVHWAMPIWPAWDLVGHFVDNRLYARLTVDKEGVAEVRIYWYSKKAAETRSRPLEADPPFF